MPIYLGTKKLDEIYLGTKGISQVYLGTKLVFQKGGPAPPSAGVLFDNGWVSGIAWSGNYLPRPQYTSIASYDFSKVDTEGIMRLIIASEPNYSNVNHNCHVCTSTEITVPAGATIMKVNAWMSDNSGDVEPYIKFGLLTPDCVNSMDDTNGGQLSAVLEAHYQSTDKVYQLTLNNGIAGNSFLAVINLRRSARANHTATLSIKKVWFE